MIVESPLPKIVIPSNIGYSDYALCALEKFGQRIALVCSCLKYFELVLYAA